MGQTLWLITGTINVTHGETFTTFHDDGITIDLGGLQILSSPGPSSKTETTAEWTGASGRRVLRPPGLSDGRCDAGVRHPGAVDLCDDVGRIRGPRPCGLSDVAQGHLDGGLSVDCRSTLERPPQGGLSV